MQQCHQETWALPSTTITHQLPHHKVLIEMPFESFTSIPQPRSSTAVVAALSEFLAENASATSFVGKGIPKVEKVAFIESLMKALHADGEVERESWGADGIFD